MIPPAWTWKMKLWLVSRDQWMFLMLAEECFSKQRYRIKWLDVGDLNTTFFHIIIVVLNAGNSIKYLLKGDGSPKETFIKLWSITSSVLCVLSTEVFVSSPKNLSRVITVQCWPLQCDQLSMAITGEVIKSIQVILSSTKLYAWSKWFNVSQGILAFLGSGDKRFSSAFFRQLVYAIITEFY